MVAIFTGEGAGLLRGSANILGGAGQVGGANLGRGGDKISVNAANGNLVISRQDEFLVGLGLDAGVSRTYNSLQDTGGHDRDNGDQWQQSTTRRLFGLTGSANTAGSMIKRLSGDGSVVEYNYETRADPLGDGDGTDITAYWTTDGSGNHDRIEFASSTWSWIDGDSRVTEEYEAAVATGEFRVKQLFDEDGNTLAFSYASGTDKLAQVTTENGEWLKYFYDGTHTDRITQIETRYVDLHDQDNDSNVSEAFTINRTYYDYDSSGRLEYVRTNLTPDTALATSQTDRDVQSYWIQYSYDSLDRITSIAQKDGSQLDITYDTSDRVIKLEQHANALGGSTVKRATDIDYQIGYTDVTAPDGTVTRLEYKAATSTSGSGPTNLTNANPTSWSVSNGTISAVSGETNTALLDKTGSSQGFIRKTNVGPFTTAEAYFEVSLKKVPGQAGKADIWMIGSVDGYVPHSGVDDWVLSGPGTIADYGNGIWRVTGLSETGYTTVRFKQTYSVAQPIEVRVRTNGADVIVANPIVTDGAPAGSGGTSTSVGGGELTKLSVRQAGTGTVLQEVSFEYDTEGNVTKTINALGEETVRTFDEAGNTLTVTTKRTGSNDIFVERNYDDRNNLIREKSFSVVEGTAQAERYSRYVYDADNNLRFMIDPEGRVIEHLYNYGAGGGTLSATRAFTEHNYTVGSTIPSLTDMSTWVSNQGNISSVALTSFIYDLRGNATETIGYGIATAGGSGTTTEGTTNAYSTYDYAGRLLFTRMGSESATEYRYDGMGRMDYSNDPANGTTTITFDDANSKTVITSAGGYVMTSTYNKAGELISEAGAGAYDVSATSQYAYNDLGQLKVFTDARGHHTYFIYDAVGLKTGEVSEDGHMTEYFYDDGNRMIASVNYKNVASAQHRIDLGDTANTDDAGDVRPNVDDGDVWTWTVYDDVGRVLQTLGNEGVKTASRASLVEFTYDDAGQLIKTTAYANTVDVSGVYQSPASIAVVKAIPVADPNNDIVTRSFYDAAGLIVGSLDGEGYLTESIYDEAGRAVENIAYSEQVNNSAANWTNATFAQLRENVDDTPADDRRTRNVYDGRGYLRYAMALQSVDGINEIWEVTKNEYANGTGRLEKATVVQSTLSISSSNPDYSFEAIDAALERNNLIIQDILSWSKAGVSLSTSNTTIDGTLATVLTSNAGASYVHASNWTSAPVQAGKTAVYTVDLMAVSGSSTTQKVRLDRQTGGIAGDTITARIVSGPGTIVQVWDGEHQVTGLSTTVATRVEITRTLSSTGPSDHLRAFVYMVLNGTAGGEELLAANASVVEGTAIAGADRSITTSYDASGRVISITDTAGLVTSYGYDSQGNVNKVVSGTGEDQRITRSWFSAGGQLIYSADAAGFIVENIYNAESHLTATRQHSGAIQIDDDPVIGTVAIRLGYSSSAPNLVPEDLMSWSQVQGGTRQSAPDVNGAPATRLTSSAGAGYTYNYNITPSNVAAGETLTFTVNLQAVPGSPTAHVFGMTSWPYNGSDTHSARIVSGPGSLTPSWNGSYEVSGLSTSEATRVEITRTFIGAAQVRTDIKLNLAGNNGGAGGVELLMSGASVVVGAPATGPDYIETTFEYDAQDRLKAQVNAEGERTEYAYFGNGLLHTTTSAQGTAHDEALSTMIQTPGGVVKQMAYGSGTSEATTQAFTYDAFGRQVVVTDGRTNDTSYEYDRRGLLTKVTDAGGGVTTYVYNAYGEVVNASTTNDYADAVTDQDSFTYYDQLGRAFLMVDAEGYATETTYTRFGEIETVRRYYDTFTGATATNPPTLAGDYAETKFTYDDAGRLAKTTDAEGYEETYTYTQFSERLTITSKSETDSNAGAAGNVSTYIYNDRGLLAAQVMPIRSVDETGTTRSTAVGSIYLYDARGNQIEMFEAVDLGGVDTLSEVEALIDSNGDLVGSATLDETRVTEFIYDDANRLIQTKGEARTVYTQSTHLEDSTTFTPEEHITYDERGNVASTTDAAGNKSVFFYDDLNRKVIEVNAIGTYTAYTYDKNSNVTNIKIYADPLTGPPSDGGAASEAPSAPGTIARETSFEYDSLNRMTKSSVVLPSGYKTGSWNGTAWTNATTSTLDTLYVYDALGNVVKTTDPEGNETYAYYDDLSRKTAQLDGEGYLTAWEYNSEGNVTKETRFATQFTGTTTTRSAPTVAADTDNDRVTEYTYDKVGNRLTEKRLNADLHDASNVGHTTTSDVTVTYTYNGLGQVLTKTEATGDLLTYVYDDGGRLEYETRPSYSDFENANVTPRVDYAYDGLGNLTRTEAQGKTTAGDRVTQYQYGAGGLLSKMTDAEGNETEYFYDKRGLTLVEQYTRTESDGTTVHTEARLSSHDQLGRVIEQTVGEKVGGVWAKGDITSMAYNAFGDVVATGINKSGTASSTWQQQNKYDLAGRMWATNSGDGVWKYVGYDQNGNQTIAVTSAGKDLYGIAANSSNTFFELGDFTSATAISQANVNATYTFYDSRNMATISVEEGRQLSSTSTLDLTSSMTYNAFGEVETQTDALGNITTLTYNTMGRVIRTESPTVEMTKEDGTTHWIKPSQDFYYDASGRLVAQRDANGTYATGGTSTGGTSKAANTGNLTQLELLAGTGFGETNPLVTKQINADGGEIETRYDIHGDARTLIDALNRETDQTFDNLGRLTQTSRPGGLIDNFAYDERGQQLTRWNNVLGSGNIETSDYDLQGRVIKTRAFGGDLVTMSYNWNGTLEAAGTGLTDVGGWTQVTTYYEGTTPIGKTLTQTTDVFGRSISKRDLGANVTTYNYDVAGRQNSQAINNLTGSDGTVSYTYFNTGNQSGQSGVGGTATYKYDALGNRTYEYLSKSGVLKDATITYDAQSRMVSYNQVATSDTPAINLGYRYDAHGNVRSVATTRATINADGNPSGSDTFTRWNRFDSMNRLVTADGNLVNGTIVRGSSLGSVGTDHFYNLASERVQSIKSGLQLSLKLYSLSLYGETYYARDHFDLEDMYYSNEEYLGNNGITEVDWGFIGERITVYDYDDAGQLEQVRAARSKLDLTSGYFTYYTAPAVLAPSAPGPGEGVIADYDYDPLGRLISQQDYNGSSVVYSRQLTYNAKNLITSEITATAGLLGQSTNVYAYGSGASYALGSAISITTTNTGNGVKNTKTTNTYKWREGAIQNQTTFDPDTATTAGGVHTNSFFYNAAGQITSVSVSDGDPRTVTYKTDEQGQILQRKETGSDEPGNPRNIYTRFGQAELGHVGNNNSQNGDYSSSTAERSSNGGGDLDFRFRNAQGGTTAGAFSQGNDPINTFTAQATNSRHTVRSGETLYGIASAIWGDGNLWYKIAQANGLSGDAGLVAGRTLHIPHNVTRSSFHADTFKTYDPSKALGDTSPTTPEPPKAQGGGGCGIVGQILATIVAVAASYVFGPILGNVVSQGFNNLIGIQDGFSFKSLAISTISAGVGGGLNGAFATVKSSFVRGVLEGATASTITQGISVATGLQNKFSFAGVAAAGIGSGVGRWVGARVGGAGASGESWDEGTGRWRALDTNGDFFSGAPGQVAATPTFGNVVVSGAANTIATAVTRSALTGRSFGDTVLQVIPDVIGQVAGRALGNAAGGSIFGDKDHDGFVGVLQDISTAPTRLGATVGSKAAELVTSIANDVSSLLEHGATVGARERAQHHLAISGRQFAHNGSHTIRSISPAHDWSTRIVDRQTVPFVALDLLETLAVQPGDLVANSVPDEVDYVNSKQLDRGSLVKENDNYPLFGDDKTLAELQLIKLQNGDYSLKVLVEQNFTFKVADGVDFNWNPSLRLEYIEQYERDVEAIWDGVEIAAIDGRAVYLDIDIRSDLGAAPIGEWTTVIQMHPRQARSYVEAAKMKQVLFVQQGREFFGASEGGQNVPGHEFGHMIGLPDEYLGTSYIMGYEAFGEKGSDFALRASRDISSVMNVGISVRPRHYELFGIWAREKVTQDLMVSNNPWLFGSK